MVNTKKISRNKIFTVIAYFIAVGFYRLKDYEKVISRSEKILKIEPDNHQVNKIRFFLLFTTLPLFFLTKIKAKDLKSEAEKKLQRDGLIGMGIAAGAASLIGGVAVAGIAALAARNKMK